MYCPECGKHNPEGSNFCQHCGIKFEEYRVETKKPLTSDTSPYPYVISTHKLVILSVTTFGLYEVYWFYKHWKSFKADRDLKVTPWVRAVFATIMSYSLFKEISKAIKSVDKTRKVEAGLLSIAYFILITLYKLPDPYWWLSFLSVLPLISVQYTINDYWKAKYGDQIIPSRFGLWNWIWTAIGSILLLLVMYASFAMPAENSPAVNSSQTESDVKELNKVNNQPSSDYNQDEIVSSVVNIFCKSAVAGEDISGGSGTILTEDGLILTNSHVIPQDKKSLHVDQKGCLVVLPDSKSGQPKEVYWAHPIVIPSLSEQYDLAYMSIYAAYYDDDKKEYDGVYPQKFSAFKDTTRCANTDIKLGESVRIFGYPAISGGYSLTVTDGVVSSFPGDGLIVTSAKISHGNSGGLAVDKNGCMVGVPSLVSSDESESLGVIYSMDLVNKFYADTSGYVNKK